jgi:hypothetical protein
MMYEVVMEETFQPEYSRAYQSQRVLHTNLSLADAQFVVADYNNIAEANQYFFYRESK